MPADRFGETESGTEEVYGRCFAVVLTKDRALRFLFWRETVKDSRDRRGMVLPTEHVSVLLLYLAPPVVLGLRSFGERQHGGILDVGVDRQDRQHKRRCDEPADYEESDCRRLHPSPSRLLGDALDENGSRSQ